jgi:hypothetical protein
MQEQTLQAYSSLQLFTGASGLDPPHAFAACIAPISQSWQEQRVAVGQNTHVWTSSCAS